MKSIDIVVRGYHCDGYGHVNNARYLEFLEEARWSFLEPLINSGIIDPKQFHFVIVNIDISFKKPVFPNQKIEVSVDDVSFNNVSLVFKQRITKDRGNEECTTAAITFVILEAATQKPIVIDQSVRDKFVELLN